MADSRKLDLIFKDSKKATKNIRIPNPRTDVDKEAVLPVMEKVHACLMPSRGRMRLRPPKRGWRLRGPSLCRQSRFMTSTSGRPTRRSSP